MTHKSRDEVWAVVRVDHFHDDSTPLEDRMTVKEVVWDRDSATAEVRRLNEINRDKKCVYFASMTRLFPAGTSAGETADDEAGQGGIG